MLGDNEVENAAIFGSIARDEDQFSKLLKDILLVLQFNTIDFFRNP